MTREKFCELAYILADYSSWERKLYECGMNLDDTPANAMANAIYALMCDGNPDWDYDIKLGFSWIIEWCFGEARSTERHSKEWDLTSASALYDFLVFMNEHGWED